MSDMLFACTMGRRRIAIVGRLYEDFTLVTSSPLWREPIDGYREIFPVSEPLRDWHWKYMDEIIESAVQGYWGRFGDRLWFQTEEDAVLAILMLNAKSGSDP